LWNVLCTTHVGRKVLYDVRNDKQGKYRVQFCSYMTWEEPCHGSGCYLPACHCRSKYDSRTGHVAYNGGQSGTWTRFLLLVLQFHHVIFIIPIFDTYISFICHHRCIWLAVDSVLIKKFTKLNGLILSDHCNILNTSQDTMYLSKDVYRSLK